MNVSFKANGNLIFLVRDDNGLCFILISSLKRKRGDNGLCDTHPKENQMKERGRKNSIRSSIFSSHLLFHYIWKVFFTLSCAACWSFWSFLTTDPSNIISIESEEQFNSSLRKVQGTSMWLCSIIYMFNFVLLWIIGLILAQHLFICCRWIFACNILLHCCLVWAL